MLRMLRHTRCIHCLVGARSIAASRHGALQPPRIYHEYHQSDSSQSSSSFYLHNILLSAGLGLVFTAYAKSDSDSARSEDSEMVPDFEALDKLYTSQKIHELSAALVLYGNVRDVEIIWRRARCEWELVKLSGKKTEKNLGVVMALADEALAVDEKNYNAHRWKAILINAYAETQGIKAVLLALAPMRVHLLRAVELNPLDSSSLTMLGIWYFEIMEMAWYQTQFARTFLGDVPPSSYEEALKYFLMAEEAAPEGWNKNVYLLGKCYWRMGDVEKARMYLERVLTLKITISDDHATLELAKKVLKKLPKL